MNFELKPINNDQRIVRMIVALVMLFTASFFSLFDPLYYPITSCGFKNTFGIPCPSCGLSRSAFSLAHFHFKDAFEYNLMGPILFFICFIIFILYLWESIKGKKVVFSGRLKSRKILFLGLLLTWFISWIIAII